MNRIKPRIYNVQTAARSKLFQIESVSLRFGSGRKVQYERMANRAADRDAVLMVPILNNDTLLLVREYAVGIDEYILKLPQGLIDAGETPAEAANRELMEEVGFASGRLEQLGKLTPLPNCLPYQTTVFLADALIPGSLPGDEPEPLEVIHQPLRGLPELLAAGAITESSSIAALCLANLRRRRQVTHGKRPRGLGP